MPDNVNKDEWVAMFRDIGLDEKTMMKWHSLFEHRHPSAHRAFLNWLGIPSDEIARIRAASGRSD